MNDIYSSYWLPINASSHGAGVDQLIELLHWFSLVLFVGRGAFMAYCLFRFRARAGHKAQAVTKHFKLPTYLEIGIAGFEVFLLIFLSYPIWAATKTNPPSDEESTLVHVWGEQFAWSFHYPGKDGKFGKTDPTLIDAIDNPVGIDREDPYAKDDFVTIGEMFVPVNKPVKTVIMSKDVIHSFGVPVMRVKQDAIPGSRFPNWWTPTMLSPKPNPDADPAVAGGFEVVCSQLCGVGHTTMKALIHVLSEEEFNAWTEERHAEVLEEFGDEDEDEDEEEEEE